MFFDDGETTHNQLEVRNDIHSKSDEEVETHTNRELIQRTYGIPITYLASLSQGYWSYSFRIAFVQYCFNRAGPNRRKPKSPKKKGITMANHMTNIALNQVAVALKLIKEYTRMTR